MTDNNEKNRIQLWRTLSRAIHAELRETQTIRGVSGIDHPVQAIAVDDKGGRVIIVSAEQNARIAALMQGDIQATMPHINVLVARPIAVDLASMARSLLGGFEKAEVNVRQLKAKFAEFQALDQSSSQRFIDKHVSHLIAPARLALQHVTLPIINQLVGAVQQLSYVDWNQVIQSFSADNKENASVSFEGLTTFDNMAIDRQFGVCAIPLYEFTEGDWDLFLSDSRMADVESRLRALNIYQYFFPAPDQLALGLTDKGIHSENDIVAAVSQSAKLGHPLGDSELVPSTTSLTEIVEALRDLDLVAEGELGVELSTEGRNARLNVKFRPREGLLSKIINRFNIKVDASLRDIYRP
jgi:hypothetical protein